ncbi:hypothetical protein LTS18_001757, partial [Coniosporium uncinatum]
MVENERRRQEEQQKRKSRALSDKILSPSVSGPVPSSPDIVWFDHAIEFEAGVVFNGVKLGTDIRTGNATDVTMATAIASHPTKSLLVVKKFTASPSESVNSPTKQESRLKRDIQAIETELSILKKLRYPSIISVLDYKIETDNGWNITILTEFGNAGPLRRALQLNSLPVDTARAWSIDLLEALDFYHRNGLVHKRIHADNVLLLESPRDGALSIRLSDAAFQQRLHEVQDEQQARVVVWIAPELASTTNAPKTPKTD